MLNATWSGAASYAAAGWRIHAAWGDEARLAPRPIPPPAQQVGAPVISQQLIIAPAGWLDSTPPAAHFAGREDEYGAAQYILNASWAGAAPYAPPVWGINATWGDALVIVARPILPPDDGVPAPFVTQPQRITGAGGIAPPDMAGSHTVTASDEYVPAYGRLDASWFGASEYWPPRWVIGASWGDAALIAPAGIAPAGVGQPAITQQQVIAPAGIAPGGVGDGSSALFPWQYAAPRWRLNASWVGAGEYTPPRWVLDASWTLPGEDGIIACIGFTDGRFGNTHIRNNAAIVKPSSIPPAMFGTDTMFGADTEIAWANRRITAEGWQDDKWTDASPPGVAPFVQWSRGTFVSHFLRRIYGRDDWLSERIGRAWIAYNPRAIQPAGIAPGVVGYPALSDHNAIFAEGWQDTRWGASVRPPYQDVMPGGWQHTGYGNASVECTIRSVAPHDEGRKARYGHPTVWLYQQYIETDSTSETSGLRPDDGTGERSRNWGRAVVRARNRSISTYGYPQARFGYTTINLGARALLPAGIAPPDAAPPVLPPHRVAHWRQVVRVDEPVRSALVSSWAVVWNKARLLRPAGWDSAVLGAPALTKLRQYVTRAGGVDSAGMGAGGMVSFRVRYIVLDDWNSIRPPVIAVHSIEHLSRVVQPASICNFNSALGRVVDEFGTPDVVERFTIIRPRWVDGIKQDTFGVETSVRNLTPEIHARGKRMDEWGAASIRTAWREVLPWGSVHTAFGRARIADRRQWVQQAGVRNTPAVGWHKVEQVGVGQPWTQSIDLRRFRFDTQQGKFVEEKEGFGIAPPDGGHLPRPAVIGVSAWPEGWADTRFGSADVWFGGVRVEPGIAHFPFGDAAVTLKNRTIAPESIGQQVQDGTGYPAHMHGSFGFPRLSPHTIYACVEAPAQAIRNHPAHQNLLPINAGEVFGRATVGGHVRTIRPRGILHGGAQNPWGMARVELLRRYLRPEGWRSQRFGWPVLPCEQHIIFDDEDYALPQEAWGRASVGFPPEFHRTVRAGGWDSFVCGEDAGGKDTHEVQNFHRELLARGWDSAQMGGSRPERRRYMPQSLRVGFPDWPATQGFDAALWGKAWVSHRVREVLPWGWQAEDFSYTLEQFEHRLRVRRTGDAPVTPQPQPGAAQTIWPQGWASAPRCGLPDISNKQHRVKAGVICPPTNQVSILAEVRHA